MDIIIQLIRYKINCEFDFTYGLNCNFIIPVSVGADAGIFVFFALAFADKKYNGARAQRKVTKKWQKKIKK